VKIDPSSKDGHSERGTLLRTLRLVIGCTYVWNTCLRKKCSDGALVLQSLVERPEREVSHRSSRLLCMLATNTPRSYKNGNCQ